MHPGTQTSRPLVDRLRADPSMTSPQDLADWSARAAVEELLENWEPALRQGSTFHEVISDVDRVIERLQAFKALAFQHHQASTQQ